MFLWSKETGVELGFIQPGKPTQNSFVESLNVKLRNEYLDLFGLITNKLPNSVLMLSKQNSHCDRSKASM